MDNSSNTLRGDNKETVNWKECMGYPNGCVVYQLLLTATTPSGWVIIKICFYSAFLGSLETERAS